MKMKNLLMTALAIIGLTAATIAQTCWQQVSTTNDSYFRILKTGSGNYLCSAAGFADPNTGTLVNAIYQSNDLISWNPTTTSFPTQPFFAFNKDNNNSLYISTAHDGLYKSTDNGSSWSFSNVGSGFGCGSLDISSDTLNTLYLGVGGFCRGLHISSDEGLNWTNKIPGQDFTDIDVINSINQVYACNTSNNIFYSNDNGNNWQQIIDQPFSNNAIMIKHLDSNIFIFSNDGNIYKSLDAGLSWTLFSNIPIVGTATPYLNDVVIVDSNIWWVGISQIGIWRSDDNGDTWTQEDDCITGDFHYLFFEGNTILATTSTGIFKFEEENCSGSTQINQQIVSLLTGSNASITSTSTLSNPTYIWQSNLGQDFQTLNDFGNYSGTNSSTLSIDNVQLQNHNQPFRVIATSGECIDTSNVATISILDTCVNSINDTTFITVTDTLVINTLITGVNPSNNSNTIKVYPNPANSHITIEYGDFTLMNGYQLRIENSLGQEVYLTAINQESDYLSLNTWGGNGLYFVHIVDPQGNTVDIRKIVLQ
jgi:photosystem II stability/assembly factor-like uncharacterized protein